MRSINEFFVTIVAAVLALSAMAWYRKQAFDLEVRESLVDGQEYLVRKLPDAQAAADYLARIKNNMLRLISHLETKYPKNPTVSRLARRFRPESLSEASSWTNGTSYSLNKGQQIVMCLRHKPDNRFVDLNTMTFVTLHELAHLASESRGHTSEFWENFKFILREAIALGLYDYHAYHEMPIDYCGTKIKDTPLK